MTLVSFFKKTCEVIGGTKESIDAIPQSGEKFMTFKKGNLKVIDSYQLFGASLDKVVASLKSPGDDPYKEFHIISYYAEAFKRKRR